MSTFPWQRIMPGRSLRLQQPSWEGWLNAVEESGSLISAWASVFSRSLRPAFPYQAAFVCHNCYNLTKLFRYLGQYVGSCYVLWVFSDFPPPCQMYILICTPIMFIATLYAGIMHNSIPLDLCGRFPFAFSLWFLKSFDSLIHICNALW